MRVTNQMVTSNTLLYLNRTQKGMLDLNQQLTTGKKIGKPSDDPISAVRALKLRTDLSEINQYKRNVDDAISWIDVTEQAMTNVTDMYKRIRVLSGQGASDTYTHDDQMKILQEIRQLTEQLANEGNVTYAGRYVFSGYKTDTPLVYTEDVNVKAEIEQSFGKDNITKKKVVVGDPPDTKVEEVYRIRLGYDNIESIANVGISNPSPSGISSFVYSTSDATGIKPYNPPQGTAYVLQDTGEIIFNKTDAEALINNPDFNLDITYNKDGFKAGEQVPQHYYKTNISQSALNINYEDFEGNKSIKITDVPIKDGSISNLTLSNSTVINSADIVYADSASGVKPAANQVVVYKDTGRIIFGTNYDAATGVQQLDYQTIMDGSVNQDIKYETSVDQTITVNTLGKNVLTTDALRDLREIIDDVTKYVDKIEEIQKDPTKSEEDKLAEIKVYQDVISDYYDRMISHTDEAMDQISYETATLGSKSNRLDLTKNRLGDDKINFTELLSKTEDIDMVETIIELQSHQVVYNSALMSSSKIVQQSLLDFLR